MSTWYAELCPPPTLQKLFPFIKALVTKAPSDFQQHKWQNRQETLGTTTCSDSAACLHVCSGWESLCMMTSPQSTISALHPVKTSSEFWWLSSTGLWQLLTSLSLPLTSSQVIWQNKTAAMLSSNRNMLIKSAWKHAGFFPLDLMPTEIHCNYWKWKKHVDTQEERT